MSLHFIEENQESLLPKRQRGREKAERYTAVNSNVSLKESGYTALLTLIQIPEKILINHQSHETMILLNEFLKRLYIIYAVV